MPRIARSEDATRRTVRLLFPIPSVNMTAVIQRYELHHLRLTAPG
jgi:hypothetical protein